MCAPIVLSLTTPAEVADVRSVFFSSVTQPGAELKCTPQFQWLPYSLISTTGAPVGCEEPPEGSIVTSTPAASSI